MTPGRADVTAGQSEVLRLERHLRAGEHSALKSDCAHVNEILARIGDKWTVLLIMLLGDGPKRFNQMRRLIGGISQRMLTLTLRRLERDGLVRRHVFPTTPPRVDYELTELGQSLRGPISAFGEWAYTHRSRIEAARERFDRAAVE